MGKRLFLLGFRRRNNGYYSELESASGSRGYVFVGPLQLDRDYQKRMQETQKLFEYSAKRIIRNFTDYENELAGFSWIID
jgi:hypothetical protein